MPAFTQYEHLAVAGLSAGLCAGGGRAGAWLQANSERLRTQRVL